MSAELDALPGLMKWSKSEDWDEPEHIPHHDPRSPYHAVYLDNHYAAMKTLVASKEE